MQVIGGEGKSLPQAHLIYEVFYSDGKVKLDIGRSIRSHPNFDDLNPHGTRSQRRRYALGFRPDLDTSIRVAALLYRELENACLTADEVLPIKKRGRSGIRTRAVKHSTGDRSGRGRTKRKSSK